MDRKRICRGKVSKGWQMKEYQTEKSKYNLPRNVYMRTLYLIRDYDRLKRLRQEILYSSPPPPDGQPGCKGGSDSTADKAIQIADVSKECEAIEQAILCIPDEYRKGVVNNVMYQIRYPDTAHYMTWAKYRSRFIQNVAKNMRYI